MSLVGREARSVPLPRLIPRRGPGRTLVVVIGYGFLLWALAIVLFARNGWPPVGLSAVAAALIAFDRRLGPLPAAVLVMLAIPVGRGSEVGLPRLLGDVPVRPHDAIALVGVALSVPGIVRRVSQGQMPRVAASAPVIGFLAVGVFALAVGLVGDQAVRDIVRDTRWWSFYAIGLVALLGGIHRAPLMRAVVWGLTIYVTVILIGLLMPMFAGGLKYGAYAYDPRMRLHYGQAIFLLVATAIVSWALVRRPSLERGLLLGLLAAGIGVTLTRSLLAAVVVVGLLAAAWTAFEVVRQRDARAIAVRIAPPVVAILLGVGAGFATYQFGVTIWTPGWAYATEAGPGVRGQPTESRPVRPSLDRVFEDTENAGLAAQAGGRLASYAIAAARTAESPVIGHGLGQPAQVPWAWGGFRAREVGTQPGVDNAYLTVGLKAGAVGIAALATLLFWPLLQLRRRSARRLRAWFVPAWVAILGLTLLQSFAVSGYAPFVLSALAVLPGLGTRAITPPRPEPPPSEATAEAGAAPNRGR